MTMPDGELLPLLAVTAESAARPTELVDGDGASLPLTIVEIVALSRRWSVLSRFTAFVAVDEQGEVVSAPAIDVMQPLDLGTLPPLLCRMVDTADWGKPPRRALARRQVEPSLEYATEFIRLLSPTAELDLDRATELLARARFLRAPDRELPELDDLIEALAAVMAAWTEKQVEVTLARIEALRLVDDLVGKILYVPMSAVMKRLDSFPLTDI